MKAHYFELNLCNTFLLVFTFAYEMKFFSALLCVARFFFSNEIFIWMLSTVWSLGSRKVSRLLQTAV